MKSFLSIGDPHAKWNNVNEIRLLREKVIQLIRSQDFDAVVIMGDFANDFAKMHLAPWNEIIDFFSALKEENIEIYYIVGNHDAINNQIFLTQDHFFRVFEYMGITVVDKVLHVEGVWFVPYVPPGRFKEALETADKSYLDAKVIFCHQEFLGAKMGAIESKHGDVWEDNLPMVISGHIHDRDWLQGNILYVGAPYQTSFGDSANKTVEIIEISGKSVTTTPFDLGMPKKITIKTDCVGFAKLEISDTNRYRIRVIDKIENIIKMKKTKHYLHLKKIAKVIPQPADIVARKRNESSKDFGDLLHESIQKESDLVQTEYQEVMKDVYQAGKLQTA